MSNRQSTLLLGYGDAEHFSAAVCLFFYLVSILYIYIHLTEFKQSNIRMTFIYTSSGGESGGGDERETKNRAKGAKSREKKT